LNNEFELPGIKNFTNGLGTKSDRPAGIEHWDLSGPVLPAVNEFEETKEEANPITEVDEYITYG
jgi:hypothetical protein